MSQLTEGITPERPHSADIEAVYDFVKQMCQRLAEKRAQGYFGWDDPNQCSVERLRARYFRAVAKGDLVNVANYAMMLTYRGAELVPAVDAQGAERAVLDSLAAYREEHVLDASDTWLNEVAPVYRDAFLAGLRANPVTENLAARTWRSIDTEYWGLLFDLAVTVIGRGPDKPWSQHMVDILAVFNIHGFQVTRIPGNTQDNRESLLGGTLL